MKHKRWQEKDFFTGYILKRCNFYGLSKINKPGEITKQKKHKKLNAQKFHTLDTSNLELQ